jgi:branched-chain amino acid transport system ATP-binding protein
MTVAENIRLGAQLVAKSERAAALKAAVDRFPFLKSRMSTSAGSLSGGEQQMLAVAKNLAGLPKALLLDEPSQGLAPIIIDELVKVFAELRETGLPILLVEQNHGLVQRVATRIAVMVGGTIVLEGPTSELADRDRIAKLFLQRRQAA